MDIHAKLLLQKYALEKVLAYESLATITDNKERLLEKINWKIDIVELFCAYPAEERDYFVRYLKNIKYKAFIEAKKILLEFCLNKDMEKSHVFDIGKNYLLNIFAKGDLMHQKD